MLSRFVFSVCTLVLAVGFVVAEEYTGTIKSSDATSITVTVDGKDVKLATNNKTEVLQGKPGKEKAVKGGLKALKDGAKAMVTTDKQDGKEVVTKIILTGKKKAN